MRRTLALSTLVILSTLKTTVAFSREVKFENTAPQNCGQEMGEKTKSWYRDARQSEERFLSQPHYRLLNLELVKKIVVISENFQKKMGLLREKLVYKNLHQSMTYSAQMNYELAMAGSTFNQSTFAFLENVTGLSLRPLTRSFGHGIQRFCLAVGKIPKQENLLFCYNLYFATGKITSFDNQVILSNQEFPVITGETLKHSYVKFDKNSFGVYSYNRNFKSIDLLRYPTVNHYQKDQLENFCY